MSLQAEPAADRRLEVSALESTVFPCSPEQERFWFIEQLRPGNPALNVCLHWELRGQVSSASIEKAMRTLIARHEILRTRIVVRDGAPVQAVQPTAAFELRSVDLSRLSELERAARLDSMAREAAQTGFDLTTAPLLRVTAVRMTAATVALLVVVHHTVFDGWSIRVLGREFGEAVAALEAGFGWAPEPLPLQYADYALWRQAYLSCASFQSESEYWRKRLTDAPYFELTPDRPRGAEQTYQGAIVSLPVSMQAGMHLESAAKAHGVSLFSFGYAALVALLQRVSGQTDILVGTQSAGRDEVDLEGLIGLFINNLVLRIDAGGDPGFSELLGRADAVVRGALANQQFPFHKLVQLLQAPRDPARTPLVSINLIVQRAFLTNTRFERFELIGLPSTSSGSLYDLTFQMVGRPDGWRMSVEYNVGLFDESTALTLLQGWLRILEAVSTTPNLQLSELAVEPVTQIEAERSAEYASETEQRVARLWAELLAVDVVHPNDDFFSLGGHSLLAVRMLLRLEEELNQRVEIATLMRAPALRAFVVACTSQAAPPFESRAVLPSSRKRSARQAALAERIVALRAHGDETPILVLNNTAMLHPLGQALGESRPLYALQMCPAREPIALPERDFRDIARETIEMVRLCRPEGPYVLMGLCVLGTLALEVAQQLRADGEAVELVVLNDAWAPGYVESLSWYQRRASAWLERAHNVRLDVERMRRGQKTPSEFVANYSIVRRLKLVDAGVKLGVLAKDTAELHLRLENRWYTDHLRAARGKYQPDPYYGDVLVVRSDEALRGRYFARDLGWSQFVKGRLEVIDCPGMHAEVYQRAGSEVMARAILRILRESGSDDPAHT